MVGLTTPGDDVVVVCTAKEHVGAVAELLMAETGAAAVGPLGVAITVSGVQATSVYAAIDGADMFVEQQD